MNSDDVVVIGSGPCGAIAASQLVERGVRVTMIDAGALAPRGVIVRVADRTVFKWVQPGHMSTNRHVAVGDPNAEWFSSLSQGGLSNYWTSAVPRFAPEDFTEGGHLDERFVWPLTYDELEPFYAIAEDALVVTAGAPLANVPPNRLRHTVQLPKDWSDLVDQLSRLGHGVGALPMAKGRPWMTAMRGTGFNSYHCIVKPMLASPNFRLIRSAVVRRVLWNSSEGRADGIEYVDTRTGTLVKLGARSIVVAAGPLDSTQILLRSVSPDFPDGLGNAHGLLGRYLHDHPRQWWPVEMSRPLTALRHPVYISRGPYEADRPLCGDSMTIGNATARNHARSFYGGRATEFGVQVFAAMMPREESRVSIDTEHDDAPLRVDICYDSATIEHVASVRDRFQKVFGDVGVIARPRGPFHELHPGTSVHYAGTVRMHASPRFGVLDRWNRVHDARNVIVCDASSFTTGPEKNPTLTAMALAARAASHLADQS